MPLRVSVTGLVEINADGTAIDLSSLGRVGRLFWVYLVCERHRPVAKDQLADVLWGEDLPRSWEQMLRGNASKLRSILAAAGLDPAVALQSAFGAYQVQLPPDALVDVEEAESAVERALAAIREGRFVEAQEAAAAAAAVAARGFLPGWSGVWVEQRQAEVRDLRLRALEVLAQAAAERRQWGQAVAAAEEAVAIEPFRESAYQLLMTSHRGAGNPGEALRTYERCRRILADELGASPSTATERMYLSLLDDEPVATAPDIPPLPLPAFLEPTSASFVVGRELERGRLDAAFQRAMAEGRQAVLVAGEPGIGKTALVAGFARESHAAGARVLYGRCDEELGVAYQPFAEALGHYVTHCPLEELTAHVAVHGTQASRIAPELLRRLPDAAPPMVTASEGDRYRLFEAVTDLVGRFAQRGPAVLVLDDLHWAAPPTLALLRHVLRSRTWALLVVGTYRHTEVGPDHGLTSTLADLRREPGVERLILDGLDEDGVSAFVEGSEGHALDAAGEALARALHARTAGNPFFVGEFLRHLAETAGVYRKEGAWSFYEDAENRGVPEGVRDVLGRRLGRLSAAANRALTLASVIGMDFDLLLLERVVGDASDDVLDALDEAVGARIVIELGSGRYQFAHALVRDTVYSALTTTRRARLHHHVGTALASLPGDPESRLPSLAHHFAEAATDGAASEAGTYALAAARQAFDRSAWEDVVSFVAAGLDALSADEPAHLELQFELLLLQYETLLVMVDLPRAEEALRNAVEAARRVGSSEILARALLHYLLTTGVTDPRGAELAEEALRRLDGPAPELRSRLQAALGVSLHYREPGRGEPMTREALALARESGDAEAVYAALVARKRVLAESPHAREWLIVEEELLAMGPPARAVAGTRWMHSLGQGRAMARFVLGDRTGFESDREVLERRTTEMRNRGGGWHVAHWRPMLALLDGRFGDVESFASAAREMGPVHVAPWTVQMCKLALEQGRAGEYTDEVVRVISIRPDSPILFAMLALVHAETGRYDDALGIVEDLGANGFLRVRRGPTATVFAYVAEVVSVLGEVKWAARTYELYRPYSGLAVFSAFGSHCPGAADRYLGQLAATLGRYDDAEQHYVSALELETGMRAPPLLARTRYWYGRMLLDRDRPGDADRARNLLKSAQETAELLGMARLAVQAAALA